MMKTTSTSAAVDLVDGPDGPGMAIAEFGPGGQLAAIDVYPEGDEPPDLPPGAVFVDARRVFIRLLRAGAQPPRPFHDIRTAAKLLAAEAGEPRLPALATSWLGIPEDLVIEYQAEGDGGHLEHVPQLLGKLVTAMTQWDMLPVYQIELDMLRVAADVTARGIAIDSANIEHAERLARERHERAAAELAQATGRARRTDAAATYAAVYGHPPADDIGLAAGLATRELRGLAATGNAVAQAVLDLRHYSGATCGLLRRWSENGTDRIHPDVDPLGTVEGGVTIRSPALLSLPNVPEVRTCIIPDAYGRMFIRADICHFGAAVLAHLAGDQHLLDAHRAGVDLYSLGYSNLYGVPLESVTSEQRDISKELHLAFANGVGPEGAARLLRCTVGEADNLLGRLGAMRPQVMTYQHRVAAFLRQHGYLRTAAGRLRRPAAHAGPGALRTAMSFMITGTGADIFKQRVARLHDALGDLGRIALVDQDSLLVETDGASVTPVATMLRAAMAGKPGELPLGCRISTGPSWGDLRPVP